MKENTYKISYKNENSMIVKALSMILKDGKVYQTCKASPFDNSVPSVLMAAKSTQSNALREIMRWIWRMNKMYNFLIP